MDECAVEGGSVEMFEFQLGVCQELYRLFPIVAFYGRQCVCIDDLNIPFCYCIVPIIRYLVLERLPQECIPHDDVLFVVIHEVAPTLCHKRRMAEETCQQEHKCMFIVHGEKDLVYKCLGKCRQKKSKLAI